MPKAVQKLKRRRKLALLIPAYNEQLVLEPTIVSAINAGFEKRDIFVVSDGSTDRTVRIATRILGTSQVLQAKRSGKAGAIAQAIKAFRLRRRYVWVHTADADCFFSPGYANEIKKKLTTSSVAATGHVQSLKGGWISSYRVYEYTIGLEILRRIQTFFGVIPVIPGPTAVLRTDILDKLDFSASSLAEDMDLTLQIHRNKLGRINYAPKARTYTQDPKDLKDYVTQITRWYRGNFQSMRRHKIGRRRQRIDAYLSYIIFEQLLYILELATIPAFAWFTQNYYFAAVAFLTDLLIFFTFATWAAIINRRFDVVGAFPLFYFLRFVNLYIFFKAGYEVIILRKFHDQKVGWSTAGRRYLVAKMSSN